MKLKCSNFKPDKRNPFDIFSRIVGLWNSLPQSTSEPKILSKIFKRNRDFIEVMRTVTTDKVKCFYKGYKSSCRRV